MGGIRGVLNDSVDDVIGEAIEVTGPSMPRILSFRNIEAASLFVEIGLFLNRVFKGPQITAQRVQQSVAFFPVAQPDNLDIEHPFAWVRQHCGN